jgi:uncharacterized protein YegP (UPF0339 family)/CBS domain-containing protein
MQVKEIMTNNPACCMPDSSLQEVARLMVENDCGCIPVVDSQLGMKPIGTITDRDITVRTVAGGQNPLEMKASDIMSIDIATVKPVASLEECLSVMEDKEIRRILVVDDQGRCCGIVAQADIAQIQANPARTGEYLREISDSPASRTMTMSRDYDNNRSYLNINTVLPVLLGIGSVTALLYYLGQRNTNRREDFNYQTEEHMSMPVHDSAVHPYVDASNEVSRRQRNLENRVQAIKSEIESVTEGTEPTETAAAAAAAGRFELKESAGGQFYFNLRAGNGQIILSSEMYSSRNAAEKGIDSVKRNAADAKRYDRRKSHNDQPYFVLKAGNGEVIGKSEIFSSETAMENGISSTMKNAPTAEISATAG